MTLQRSLAGLLAVVLGMSLLASTATANANEHESGAGVRAVHQAGPVAAISQTPRIDVVALGTLALSAATNLAKCEDLAAQGTACLRDPSIRDVLNRLDEIEAQIAQNQARTEEALMRLQVAVDQQALVAALRSFDDLEGHIFQAAFAWDAMSKCTQKAATPGATCKGHEGAKTQAVPVAEGIRVSRLFFNSQMREINISIQQAAQRYAGVSASDGRTGLLHALWQAAQGQQDSRSSRGTDTVGRRGAAEVITRGLSQDFLPVATYYRDLIFVYGALRPAFLQLSGRTDDARSQANLANAYIFGTDTRWRVAGSFQHYRIPDLPAGSIAYVDHDRGTIVKIIPGQERGQALSPADVNSLGRALRNSRYSVAQMVQTPNVMPHGGAFSVYQSVKHRTNPYYLGRFAICASTADIRPCDFRRDGTEPATWELGWSEPVGSRDRWGNLMKNQWLRVSVRDSEMTWDIERNSLNQLCSLRGSPPSGVWNVDFRGNFDRYAAGRFFRYEWAVVSYEDSVRRYCVGAGVYARVGTAFSAVELPIAGILRR